jgi:predicted Zn-dependent peptidase
VSKTILASILKERIVKDLREQQGITYSPIVSRDDGILILQTSTDLGKNTQNLQKVMECFDKNTREMMQKPVTEEELENVKKVLRIDNKIYFEDSGDRNDFYLQQRPYPYGIYYFEGREKALDEIRPEHIQRAAKLVFENPSVISVTATKKEIEANKEYLKSKGEIIKIPDEET